MRTHPFDILPQDIGESTEAHKPASRDPAVTIKPAPAIKDLYNGLFPVPQDQLSDSIDEQIAKLMNLCQIRQLGELCEIPKGRFIMKRWLMLNPAIVDRLSSAVGFSITGSYPPRVERLIRCGERFHENVPNPNSPHYS